MKVNSGKVALVTGAGRGLGAALARQLARAGYDVAVHFHSSQRGAVQTAAAIRKIGRKAVVFPADLASDQEARRLAAEIRKTFGRLDVLINNAGVYHPKSLETLTEAEWFEGINSTATAAFFLTRAVLPLLRKTGRGRVVNIGDSSCDRPSVRDLSVSYHIGKTGVLMLTKSFAQKEAAWGVTVNMVSPGWLANSLGLPRCRTIPAGRFGTFADIGNAVEFFLKPESGYVTGSQLVASGGWNLR